MSKAAQEKAQDECTAEATAAGFKAAAQALVAAGTAVGLANQFWAGFRRSLGVSGKTALIVSTSKVHYPTALLA